MTASPTPLIPESERLRFKMRQAPVTAALVITFIAVWVVTRFDLDHVIFLKFAKVNDRVRAGEVWRLFTASFLHAGLLHIWFNATALAAVGPVIERVYGKVQYLAAFLLGGAVGLAASVLFTPGPAVGASAGIFALLGVLLAYAVRQRGTLLPQMRRVLVFRILFVVGLNVLFGVLVSFVDNAAHLGGLLGGFALGLLLRPRTSLVETPPAVQPRDDRAPLAPAVARRRASRSYLRWAGQRWKMIAFLVSHVPFGVFMYRLFTFDGQGQDFPGWEMLAAFVAFFVGAGIAISARCPGCKVRVFWWCVSKLPENKGLGTAICCENCPVCGYPDGETVVGSSPVGPTFGRA